MTAPFDSLDAFAALVKTAPGPDLAARADAEARNAQLTKPAGALGRLEALAIWFAGWRGDARPRIHAAQVIVFAGDHGVALRGASPFPPEVTGQMVANFAHGGAAINQLSALAGAALSVIPLEVGTPTADFTEGPAMSAAECVAALAQGWQAVDPKADALIVGEMGIGNTTAAAAMAAAMLGGGGADWVGPGAGHAPEGVARKAQIVDAGLARNPSARANPLEALRCLGGREIAAMTGAIAAARAARIPVILDGFICGAAACVLDRLTPGALDHCAAGHVSAETAHEKMLRALGKTPILSLDMRLGEASGATAALLILRAALATHSGMATFAEAGVSGKS